MSHAVKMKRRRPTRNTLAIATLASSLILAAGCTRPSPTPHSKDLLAVLSSKQTGNARQQRAAMISRIRADVRQSAASADTPAFEEVLRVIGRLPREQFVLRDGLKGAYVDLPQAIGYGQTISDPYVVAIMTAAIKLPPNSNVLDVGTGSGYQAAVLARIARHVSSIEIVQPLAISAAARLRRLHLLNVDVRSGDGFLGWLEHAPFDGIIVAASATTVPAPLIDQLKPGGRLVMPIGPSDTSTQLVLFTKHSDNTIERCSLGGAMFVPMTGPRTAPFAPLGLMDHSIPFCFKKPIVLL